MSAFLKSIRAASLSRTACRLKKSTQHFSDLTAWQLHLNRTGKLWPRRTRLVFSFQPGGMKESRTDRAFLVPLFINWMEKCLAYFFKLSASLRRRGETRPTSTTPHRCQHQQQSCVSPAKAGLDPCTYPHPELMRLTVLVLSAWKMDRLNRQDKKTGRRHSGNGFCRSSSEKTIVALHPPALLSSCYHTMLLLNRLQGFLAPPCHAFGQSLPSFHSSFLFARNAW